MTDQVFNFPIEEFAARFHREYAFLYDAFDRVAGFQEAVDTFDALMKRNEKFRAFVSEFVAFREDMITSDREAAAFMYVMSDMINMSDPDTGLSPVPDGEGEMPDA